MTPHQNKMPIKHHTTIKDIIHVNQLLHSLTAKNKENESIVKKIIAVMNVVSVLNIQSRKQQIHGLCYICFEKVYLLKDRTSSKICVYCKKERNHHRSLYLK